MFYTNFSNYSNVLSVYSFAEKVRILLLAGAPVNSFESIVSPILQSLGYKVPKITIDVKHALFMSRIFLVIYTMLYPWLNRWWLPQPLLLPAEVYKVSLLMPSSYIQTLFNSQSTFTLKGK